MAVSVYGESGGVVAQVFIDCLDVTRGLEGQDNMRISKFMCGELNHPLAM